MDRIKIRFERPEFIHKGNVTICLMSYTVPELCIFSRVKAISKCKEGDEYDQIIGERISQARAEIAARNEVKEFVLEEIRLLKIRKVVLDNLVEEIKIFNSHDKEAILKFVEE